MTRRKLPWARVLPGKSFAFPSGGSLRATQVQATARAAYQKRRYGRRFVVRTVVEKGRTVVRLRRVA